MVGQDAAAPPPGAGAATGHLRPTLPAPPVPPVPGGIHHPPPPGEAHGPHPPRRQAPLQCLQVGPGRSHYSNPTQGRPAPAVEATDSRAGGEERPAPLPSCACSSSPHSAGNLSFQHIFNQQPAGRDQQKDVQLAGPGGQGDPLHLQPPLVPRQALVNIACIYVALHLLHSGQ